MHDDALARASALVARGATGWTVGGADAGTSADSLADALYERWYTQPEAPAAPSEDDPPVHRRSLLGALHAAHALATTTTAGWVVTGSDPRGLVSVVRDEAVRVLRPGEYVMPLRPGVPPAPGEPVEPVARLDHFDAERALWWTFTDPPPEPPIGRVYFNARPATAPRAVHEITAALVNVAYQLKCPILAAACERVDAIVLYHARSQREAVLAALTSRPPALEALLDPAVPSLTCRVLPGMAIADDVEEGRSFGESRCHLLAGALAAAAATWASLNSQERLAVLLAALDDAGVDPQRPWLAAA